MDIKTWHSISRYMFRNKWLFAVIFFLSILSALSNIIAPIYVGKIVDVLFSSHQDNLTSYLITLLIIYLILFFSSLFLNLSLTDFASKITQNIREDLYQKLHRLPISWVDHSSFGDIVNFFTTDTENLANGILQSLSKITMGIITVSLSIVLMIKINVLMTILLITITPIMYYISKTVTHRTSNQFQKKSNLLADLNGYTEEIISGHKTFQDFTYEKIALKNFQKQNQSLYQVGVNSQFYSSLTNPSTRFVSNFAYILIGLTGIFLTKLGKISIGNISTFLMYTTIFTRPFNEITSILSEIQTAFASSKRIFEFLDQEEEQNSHILPPVSSFNGYIEFKNVDFSYDKNKKFITNFNLSVKKGENIAIVGKTGSGKTTLINLLMRFYEIDHGKIEIDGINIQNISKDFLRKNIGLVLQDTKLFTGTIRENIAYGKENVSEEEIKKAATLAHANFFIERLPNQYDTMITHEDLLSSGEVQLINIARILLLHPPILILDEATSNIDLLTEHNIGKAFETLIQNSTSFVIAHRLSTIQNADRILYIENGNIVEEGTHSALLKKHGKYYDLYFSQFAS